MSVRVTITLHYTSIDNNNDKIRQCRNESIRTEMDEGPSFSSLLLPITTSALISKFTTSATGQEHATWSRRKRNNSGFYCGTYVCIPSQHTLIYMYCHMPVYDWCIIIIIPHTHDGCELEWIWFLKANVRTIECCIGLDSWTSRCDIMISSTAIAILQWCANDFITTIGTLAVWMCQ